MQHLDTQDTIEDEVLRKLVLAIVHEALRDFARVVKQCVGVLQMYWKNALHLPPTHPYRQAARMLESFLEKRYGV